MKNDHLLKSLYLHLRHKLTIGFNYKGISFAFVNPCQNILLRDEFVLGLHGVGGVEGLYLLLSLLNSDPLQFEGIERLL